MRFRRLFGLVGLAGLVGLGACGDRERDPERLGRATQAVIDGGIDTSSKAVLQTGNPNLSCTGVLVAEDVVLTASHCIATAEPSTSLCSDTAYPTDYYAAKDALVFTGDAYDDPAIKQLKVAQVITIPGAKSICGNDIVALRLAAPVTTIPPLAPRLDAPPVVGEPVVVVGFGDLEPRDAESSGTRRRRDDATVSFVGVRAKTGSASELGDGDFAVSIGPCNGDSGSPAIDAQGRVIGIMSRGNSAVCTEMAYTRVDVHADWLKKVVRDAAAGRGADPPTWAALPQGGFEGGTDEAGTDSPAAGAGGGSSSCAVRASSGSSSFVAFVLASLVLSLVTRRRARRS